MSYLCFLLLWWTDTTSRQFPLMFQITDSAIKLCWSRQATNCSKIDPEDVSRSSSSCVKKPLAAAALPPQWSCWSSEWRGAPAAPCGQEISVKTFSEKSYSISQLLFPLRNTSWGKICHFIHIQTACCWQWTEILNNEWIHIYIYINCVLYNLGCVMIQCRLSFPCNWIRMNEKLNLMQACRGTRS